jgi:hypothetical protein
MQRAADLTQSSAGLRAQSRLEETTSLPREKKYRNENRQVCLPVARGWKIVAAVKEKMQEGK